MYMYMHTIESGTCKYILDKLHSNKPISPDKTQTSETKNMSGKGYGLNALLYYAVYHIIIFFSVFSFGKSSAPEDIQLVSPFS